MAVPLCLDSKKYESREDYIHSILINMEGYFNLNDVWNIIKENDTIEIKLSDYNKQKKSDQTVILNIMQKLYDAGIINNSMCKTNKPYYIKIN